MTLDKGECILHKYIHIYINIQLKKNAVNKKLYFLKFGKIDSYSLDYLLEA